MGIGDYINLVVNQYPGTRIFKAYDLGEDIVFVFELLKAKGSSMIDPLVVNKSTRKVRLFYPPTETDEFMDKLSETEPIEF